MYSALIAALTVTNLQPYQKVMHVPQYIRKTYTPFSPYFNLYTTV